MAIKYDNTPIEWKNEGTEPSEAIKESGFQSGYKPPAAFFNWFWCKVGKCIKELQEKLSTTDGKINKEYLELDKVDNTADSEKSVSFASESGVGRKVKYPLTVRFKGGSEEGTDLWTYDGSTSRSINITPEKIGSAKNDLSNVEDSVFKEKVESTVTTGTPLVPAISTDGEIYTATVDGVTELTNGLEITIIPNMTSIKAAVKLNLNGLGAKNIRAKIDGYNSGNSGTIAAFDKWIGEQVPITIRYVEKFDNWQTVDFSRPSASGLYGHIDVEQGGTGATTAEEARDNLGITALLDDKANGEVVQEINKIVDYNKKTINCGQDNTIDSSSTDSIVGGELNNVTGNATETLKNGTTRTGGFNIVGGLENDVDGSQCIVAGKWNSVGNANQVVCFGNGNIIDDIVHQAMVLGANLHATADTNNAGTLYCGKYNDTSKNGYLIVGKGSGSSRSNAFRVGIDGKVYAANTALQTGADYAEYFEWDDGNTKGEIRKGRFVTLSEKTGKIRFATSEDDFILGILSGNASVVGNSAEEEWHDKYLSDIYGEYLTDENGELILNPDYDDKKEYIPRSKRPEWAVVGLLGQIIMDDDGSCIVGKCCSPSTDGIATLSETGYRVLKRIDDTHVSVLFK